jgi:hypothetical protein
VSFELPVLSPSQPLSHAPEEQPPPSQFGPSQLSQLAEPPELEESHEPQLALRSQLVSESQSPQSKVTSRGGGGGGPGPASLVGGGGYAPPGAP